MVQLYPIAATSSLTLPVTVLFGKVLQLTAALAVPTMPKIKAEPIKVFIVISCLNNLVEVCDQTAELSGLMEGAIWCSSASVRVPRLDCYSLTHEDEPALNRT
jgi:hypothetical protein